MCINMYVYICIYIIELSKEQIVASEICEFAQASYFIGTVGTGSRLPVYLRSSSLLVAWRNSSGVGEKWQDVQSFHALQLLCGFDESPWKINQGSNIDDVTDRCLQSHKRKQKIDKQEEEKKWSYPCPMIWNTHKHNIHWHVCVYIYIYTHIIYDQFSILIQTVPAATASQLPQGRLRTRRFLSSKWGGWPQLKVGESTSCG